FKKLIKITFLIIIGLILSEALLLLIKIKAIEERDFIEYPDKKIILCIGDSYTFGGEVENKDSYPSILSEIVKEKGFAAVNLGICEADTSTISEKYINFLKTKKPEKVIFLGGTANLFGYKKPDKLFFENLKTYKLLRIFFINLKAWVLSEKSKKEIYANHIPFEIDLYKNYPANSENYYTQKTISLLFEKRDFKQAYETAIEGLERFPESINLLWLTANINFKLNNVKESEKNIKKISEFAYNSSNFDNSSLNAKGIILRGLAEWDIINYKFDKATGKIIEALKYIKKLTKYDIYVIKQTFLMQSSLSADNIY
ncbi:MAG TPA: SGNH/GDSL hydrolase family protein, partial [Elusimicrobiales bacterium]|nr:SGNH/GDSL hydrolase family protein [Elusimicrobiales bacterium]